LLVLHETRWFFEVFELPGTGSSLILMFLQIPRPSNSLILLFSSPELMAITEIKDLPHTGLYNTQTQPGLMLGSQTQFTQVTLPDWATFSNMILKT
jgi:hypothetical protein